LRGGGGFAGSAGPLRLFDTQIAGQIAWLLPLAAVGLAHGLWARRKAPRTDLARAAYVVLGVWALTGWAVLSFSQGTFHAYYTSAIAPPVAGLAAAGVVAMAADARRRLGAAALLAASVGLTGWLGFTVLGDAPGFVPWLRWVVLGAGVAAGLAVLAVHLRRPRIRRAGVVAVLAAAIAVLGGPSAYAIATLGRGQSGSDPTAGPLTTGRGQAGAGPLGFALSGGGRGGGFGALFGRREALPGVPAARGSAGFGRGGPGLGGGAADPQLVKYLESHRDGAEYLVAATGSQVAGPIQLASGAPVITMGGFMGADPAPTVAALAGLVREGKLHYVLLGGGFGPGARGGGGGFAGADFSGGGGGLSGGAGGGSVSSARQAWVNTHCQTVDYTGASSSAGPRGMSLYSCTASDA
jgi:4-amino-4-deoxy-L-arabinose transferase-like glycosyltransferase